MMEIKRAGISETDFVIELFDKYRVFYKQASDISLAQKFIRSRLENNESVIFIAFTEKIPVGFTQLYPCYSSVRVLKNWILNDLYVDAAYRQKGIGEALIRAAMRFAKEEGASIVELSTAVDNFTAQKLYEFIGFKKQKPDNEFYTYRIPLD